MGLIRRTLATRRRRFLGNPQLRALARGRVCCARLSAPELWNVLAVAAHDEIREQPCPPSLVRCAEPLSGIGMEVFVEQQKILPVTGGRKWRLGCKRRPAPVVEAVENGILNRGRGAATSGT